MKGAGFGDSIYDFPSPFTPEKVFNRFCRLIERKILNIDTKDRIGSDIYYSTREMMHIAPVFYLGMPEIKRVSEYCTENPIDLSLFPIPVLPFNEIIVANPYNATLIFDSQDRNGIKIDDSSLLFNNKEMYWRCKFITLLQEDDGWVWSVGIAMMGHHQDNARHVVIESGTLAISTSKDPECDDHYMEDLNTMKDRDYSVQIRNVLHQAICKVLDTCHYINAPRHHLVIEEPKKFNPDERRPKLPRSNDRPRIRLIEPDAVRKIYPHQTGRETSDRTVTPHSRRSHIRYLKSSRYKAAMGKQIVVRPTWVGDTEWEHGSIRYRVISR